MVISPLAKISDFKFRLTEPFLFRVKDFTQVSKPSISSHVLLIAWYQVFNFESIGLWSQNLPSPSMCFSKVHLVIRSLRASWTILIRWMWDLLVSWIRLLYLNLLIEWVEVKMIKNFIYLYILYLIDLPRGTSGFVLGTRIHKSGMLKDKQVLSMRQYSK